MEYRHWGGCVSHPGPGQKFENKVSIGEYFKSETNLVAPLVYKIKMLQIVVTIAARFYCIHFRVRVERVTSTAALSQHLQQQVLSQQQDRGAIEMQTLTSQGQKGG